MKTFKTFALVWLSITLLTGSVWSQPTFATRIPNAALATRVLLVTITSVTDANGNGVGEISETLSIHGAGLTAVTNVKVGVSQGQPVTAPILFQSASRIDVMVPTTLETGGNAQIILQAPGLQPTTTYPVRRLVAVVTDNRQEGLYIFDADTLAIYAGPYDFDAFGIVDGDGGMTQPLGIMITSTGESAYIALKKRLYMLDLVTGIIDINNPIQFTEPSAVKFRMKPTDDYIVGGSQKFPFSTFVSRIGPLPTGATSQISISNPHDIVLSPTQPVGYVTRNINQVSRFSILPTLATTHTVTSHTTQPTGNLAISTDGNTLLVVDDVPTLGPDRLLKLNAADLTSLPGSPINLPGVPGALAFLYPSNTELVGGDCLNLTLYWMNINGTIHYTLPVGNCVRHFAMPKDTKTLYGAFTTLVSPSILYKFNLVTRSMVANYVLNNSVIWSVSVQP